MSLGSKPYPSSPSRRVEERSSSAGSSTESPSGIFSQTLPQGCLRLFYWLTPVNLWDRQAIRDCVNEMLESNESMNDLVPRFSWRLLENKNVGISVRCVVSVIRRAAGLTDSD